MEPFDFAGGILDGLFQNQNRSFSGGSVLSLGGPFGGQATAPLEFEPAAIERELLTSLLLLLGNAKRRAARPERKSFEKEEFSGGVFGC